VNGAGWWVKSEKLSEQGACPRVTVILDGTCV
jgi:hypothetical protein